MRNQLRLPIKHAQMTMRIVMMVVVQGREVDAASRHRGVAPHRANHVADQSESPVVVSRVASQSDVASQSRVAGLGANLAAQSHVAI